GVGFWVRCNVCGWVFVIYWLTRDHTSGIHNDMIAVVFTSINLHHTIDGIGLANFKNQIGQTGQILFIPDHIVARLRGVVEFEVLEGFLTIVGNDHDNVVFTSFYLMLVVAFIILDDIDVWRRRIHRFWWCAIVRIIIFNG